MLSFSKKNSPGFTLIEMMVVLFIFTIMTGILLANLPNFRDKSSLELLAQQVAINIRTAQVYGIGTKASTAGGENAFDVAYGINFGTVDSGLKEFTLFTDKNKNEIYDVGEQGPMNELELTYSISGRFAIKRIVGHRPGEAGQSLNQDGLNITYKRPNTEAHFYEGPFSWVDIILGSQNSAEERVVSVYANGQITVQPATP